MKSFDFFNGVAETLRDGYADAILNVWAKKSIKVFTAFAFFAAAFGTVPLRFL